MAGCRRALARHGSIKSHPALGAWLRAVVCLLPVLLIAACAQNAGSGYSSNGAATPEYAPSQYYPPPGPPDDPWGPYISEAAARYDIPQQWIRAVMQQESGGEEQAVSPVGAIGLMQVMPDTYAGLQEANGLGDDPFNPHDNILAGAAYIKQMYDIYGSPGFLAAYNAGPEDLDAYIAGTAPLPDETVNYLAAVTPNLGNAIPFSGPLAQYAASGGGVAPTPASFASGCDVNAAYDPDHQCAAAPPPAAIVPAEVASDQVASVGSAPASAGACDVGRAYDPDNPCSAGAGSAGSCDADMAYDPDSPCTAVTPAVATVEAAPVIETPASPPQSGDRQSGDWAIQVGAFSNMDLARAVAEGARAEVPDQLGNAAVALPATTPFGGLVLYRARLVNLSAAAAIDACANLNHRQLPCIVLPSTGA
jgi:D-alanyl-D-alanine carboxypeptidase